MYISIDFQIHQRDSRDSTIILVISYLEQTLVIGVDERSKELFTRLPVPRCTENLKN